MGVAYLKLGAYFLTTKKVRFHEICHFVQNKADTLVASKTSDHNPGAGGLQPGMRHVVARDTDRTSSLTSSASSRLNRWLLFIESKNETTGSSTPYTSLAKLQLQSAEYVRFWSQLPLHTWHTLQIQNRTEHHNDHVRVPNLSAQMMRVRYRAHNLQASKSDSCKTHRLPPRQELRCFVLVHI
jgi:hypothetical protein